MCRDSFPNLARFETLKTSCEKQVFMIIDGKNGPPHKNANPILRFQIPIKVIDMQFHFLLKD